MFHKLSFFVCLLSCYHATTAQKASYGAFLKADIPPIYQVWKDNYKLTKISYYENRLIVHIELKFHKAAQQWTKSVVFTPPKTPNAWCLKDSKNNEVFPLLEIRNIQHNGKLLKQRLKSIKDKVHVELSSESSNLEIFTCEAHFDALPEGVAIVDLLEGADSKFLEGHWNFFDIQLQQFGEKTTTTPIEIVVEKAEVVSEKIITKTDSTISTDKLTKQPPLLSINDLECNKLLELNIIFLDNSTKFANSTDAERTLSLLRLYLQQYPKHQLILYGHTDIFGDEQRNLELSLQRVEKLQEWFGKHKIDIYQIKTVALGATQPIYEAGNPLNRRVEVKVVCLEK